MDREETLQRPVARTRTALKSGKLRRDPWHQGEADSNDAKLATSYRSAGSILSARSGDWNARVPGWVGSWGEFFVKANMAAVVNEQRPIPHGSATAFVFLAGLTDNG